MTTAIELIHKTFTILGIRNPEAKEVQDALDALNDMMHGWIARGWLYVHTDLTSGDGIDLHSKFDVALKYMLAEQLLPIYGAGLDDNRTAHILKKVPNYDALLAAHLKPPIMIEYPNSFASITGNTDSRNFGINRRV